MDWREQLEADRNKPTDYNELINWVRSFLAADGPHIMCLPTKYPEVTPELRKEIIQVYTVMQCDYNEIAKSYGLPEEFVGQIINDNSSVLHISHR